ncbi:MAG TPA: hypothetical protein VMZ00_12885, partial [Sporichthya sp.]|nr:hypothetical protein [Sporichthya sp.]
PDVAGPEIIDAEDLTAFWLHTMGKKRKLVPIRKPGKLYAGYREGYHLAPERSLGQQTFAEFMADLAAAPEREKAAKAERAAREKAEKAAQVEQAARERAASKELQAPKEKRAWLGRDRTEDSSDAERQTDGETAS